VRLGGVDAERVLEKNTGAYHRILKLARTSAGLAGEETIHPLDLAQTLPYRPRSMA
jgi:predicted ATPase with chaperone activity